jgi:hypothetical protein
MACLSRSITSSKARCCHQRRRHLADAQVVAFEGADGLGPCGCLSPGRRLDPPLNEVIGPSPDKGRQKKNVIGRKTRQIGMVAGARFARELQCRC